MYYDYEELKRKALESESEEDINSLGEWFLNYGDNQWNGHYYEIDNNNILYPVYNEIEEDNYELTGFLLCKK